MPVQLVQQHSNWIHKGYTEHKNISSFCQQFNFPIKKQRKLIIVAQMLNMISCRSSERMVWSAMKFSISHPKQNMLLTLDLQPIMFDIPDDHTLHPD